MKALGIVILIVGIMSLIGGFIKPSGAIPSVVLFGIVLKLGIIILGAYLISKSNKRKEQDIQN